MSRENSYYKHKHRELMKAVEDIKAEIIENQNIVSDALRFDKKHEFYNGKWVGFELALGIIDKHISGKESRNEEGNNFRCFE